LAQARRVGWRYPVLVGDIQCLAYLRESTAGLRFGGITEGVLPRRVFEAAAVVENGLKSIDAEFQPRLLEIPSLHFYALWLYRRGGASRFVPLLSHEFTSPRLRTEQETLQDIRAAVTASETK
jgi:hypothetical protein